MGHFTLKQLSNMHMSPSLRLYIHFEMISTIQTFKGNFTQMNINYEISKRILFFSILGRIIRVTDDVIDYRRWIHLNFPLSVGPSLHGRFAPSLLETCDLSGSPSPPEERKSSKARVWWQVDSDEIENRNEKLISEGLTWNQNILAESGKEKSVLRELFVFRCSVTVR